MQTRRDFLKKAATLAGAAGFSAGMPESVQRAFAIEPEPGSTWKDAEHIVILMQENRSFDHALGTLQGVRGFNDPRAIRQANGNSIFLQTSLSGATYAPWRLDIKDTKITWMGSIPHSRNSQVDAWNQGHHNAWIDSKRSSNQDYDDVPITMGHYTREDIPFYYVLADAFTVCDQNYCGAMTSTTPNRSLLWTGTVRDEQSTKSSVYMRNPEFKGAHLKWKTYPERLTDAGIDWGIYQNEVSVASMPPEAHEWLGNVGNVIEHFGAFNVHLSTGNTKKLRASIQAAKDEIAALQQKTVDASMKDDLLAEIAQKQDNLKTLETQLQQGGSLSDLSPRQQELHRRAFVTNSGDPDYHSLESISFEDGEHPAKMDVPKGDVLYQFRKDVNEGTLPTVSWLVPPGKFSDHPAHPWYGAWFLSEVVDILTKNPEVWKKTIFILTYDENDGYFDHAPSFVAADPQNRATGRASQGINTGLEYSYTPDELAQGVSQVDARSGPIGLGFRVPMIIASPWSRGGWVNSQLFDQTSILQFLEEYVEARHGKPVKETNISDFRRTICGNLTSVFRPADNSMTALPFLDRDKFVAGIQRAKNKEVPSNYTKLTAKQMEEYNRQGHHTKGAATQEAGIRPACALPYEMYCEGVLNPEQKIFSVAMRAGNNVHGAKSAGAPFNVYLRNTATGSTAAPHGEKNQNMFVATYAVKAGDTVEEHFPLQLFASNTFEIDVHGPNGFYRAFRGGSSTPSPVVVSCVYEGSAHGQTGNVQAHVKNVSTQPVSVVVEDNSYKSGAQTKEIGPGQQALVSVPSSKSHGWYDFTVQIKGSSSSTRYAGRVETGRTSFTDPLMGNVV
jgi:phospholipase C